MKSEEEERTPFVRSLRRKKCSCSIHNASNQTMDISKTPSLENLIQTATTFSKKMGKHLSAFLNNLNTSFDEKNKPNITNEDNNNNIYLEKFEDTLKKWKTLEKEYQRYLERQESMEKTLNVKSFEEKTMKNDQEVTLAQTTWKLIYDDISSDQNKDKFMDILNEWIQRDQIIGIKAKSTVKTFSSTPTKASNAPECSLNLSKIYSNASSKEDFKVLDDTSKSSESINTDNVQPSTSSSEERLDNVYPNSSSSDSGTHCKYNENSKGNLTYVDIETNNDCLIIQDMILTKFDDKIKYQEVKKSQRKKPSFHNVYESIDSLNSSIGSYDENEFLATALSDYIFEENLVTEEVIQAPPSVNTNEISDLISNEYYYYDVINERVPEVTYEETNISYNEEIKQQLEVIQQIKKALQVCHSNKELVGSREHIEAEKLLLTATSKYNVLLSSAKVESTPEDMSAPNATMYIKNITFRVKPDYVLNYTYYYICLIKTGSQVKWSNIETPKGNTIHFHNDIIFERLTPDSNVTLELYSLKVKHETQSYRSQLCGPINMSLLSKLFSRRRNTSRSTSFELVGNSTLSNVLSSDLYKLSVSTLSEIDDKYSASFEIFLNLKYDFKGFLTIRKDEVKSSWVRRWCSLKDDKLSYWSHPNEEHTMEPRGYFNLRYASEKEIKTNLNLCSRPKTMVLEMHNSGISTTYFLASDNSEEFHEWQYRLNSTVKALKYWQQMF